MKADLKYGHYLPRLQELLGVFLYDSKNKCVFAVNEVVRYGTVGATFYDTESKEMSYRYIRFPRVLLSDGVTFRSTVSLATTDHLELLAGTDWRDTGNHGERFNPNYKKTEPLLALYL